MTHKILYVPKYLILLCNVAQRWATFSNENNGLTTHNILCLIPGRTQHMVQISIIRNRQRRYFLSFLSSTSSDYHAVHDWQALSGFGVVLFLYTKRQACTIPRITL